MFCSFVKCRNLYCVSTVYWLDFQTNFFCSERVWREQFAGGRQAITGLDANHIVFEVNG